jgi:Flp pilus assembly secretin CpaC
MVMNVQTYESKTPQKLCAVWLAALWLLLSVPGLAQELAAAPAKAPAPEAAQVQLLLRVAEVDRFVLRELSSVYGVANSTLPVSVRADGPGPLAGQGDPSGSAQATSTVNLLFNGSNGPAGTLTFIRALQTRGVLRELAAPQLILVENRKTSYLAGGQFPIPILQAVNEEQHTVNVAFKELGVKLNFQPALLDEIHLRLEVESEIASLDFGAGVTIEGLVIPGVRVRRAKTVLELRDEQSFALTGLLDNTEQVNLAKALMVGEMPILGELFQSRGFQRNETELVVLMTVRLGAPLHPDSLANPLSVAESKTVAPVPALPTAGIQGLAGHAIRSKSNAGHGIRQRHQCAGRNQQCETGDEKRQEG